MNAEDLKDFRSRKSVASPQRPNKPIPKFSDTINIKRREDRERWEEMDKKLEEWRKTFNGT